MNLKPEILKAIKRSGFEEATPIQEKTIPLVLEGKDVIGQAQTGTGKTAAFGLPILQNLDKQHDSIQAIVIEPTRELAIQTQEEYSVWVGMKRLVSKLFMAGQIFVVKFVL